MTERVRALLPDYVLGGLEAADLAEVEAALEGSAELRAELDALTEDLTGLAVALPPIAPAADVHARLMASVAKDRFLPFVDELARWCDIAVSKMQEVLRTIDDATAWEGGPMPGIRLIHFDHGPACVGADTGVVEMPPGFRFPKHKHLGVEVNYILQGQLIDDDGTVYGPGDAVEKTVSDVHAYEVGGDEPLIFIAINNGFEVVGE